ncbi:proton-activated chloride channel isoform X3 [Struthio camelus]|uniref:proton-activated chloride channel isoform X3 n=1 Tax=Struthio camelus TaxID=8801 RepID=UPI00360429D3
MRGQEISASYRELSEDVEQVSENPIDEGEGGMEDHEDTSSVILPDSELGTSAPYLRFSKTCLKNVFSVILLFIYLLLMAVAVFLVYQTITDFREKLKHPVMSVSYKEVSLYDAPGIAFYPGKARLLSCKHHYYDHIPPLINPGQPGAVECTTQRINYTDPFTNQTMKYALVVQGPREVKKKELVFLQFHLNGTDQDFSAIDYLLFSSFQEFINSPEKAEFMKDCESSYSSWKFSGGFRTWVKMSLVKTKEEDGSETVEFKQEPVAYLKGVFCGEQNEAEETYLQFSKSEPYVVKPQGKSSAVEHRLSGGDPPASLEEDTRRGIPKPCNDGLRLAEKKGYGRHLTLVCPE